MNFVDKGKKENEFNLIEENDVESCNPTTLVDEELFKVEADIAFNHSCMGCKKGYNLYNKNIQNSLECKKNFKPTRPTPNRFQDITLREKEIVSISRENVHYMQGGGDLPRSIGERWSPLGESCDEAISPNSSELLEFDIKLASCSPKQKNLCHGDKCRLQHLEEEKELLTTSLLALTSHFAHVQLRVRQIVNACPEQRDKLLKELDNFAFQGIPEPKSSNVITSAPTVSSKDNTEIKDVISRQNKYDLIEYLKQQLSELEKLAYESGAPVLPQHIILKKQRVIIDELKNKLNLKVDEREMPHLSSEELKFHVDNAIGEFVSPFKMKDQLVAQLKTQITDLERFIFFLQCDSDSIRMNLLNGPNTKFTGAYNSYSAKKKQHGNKDPPFSDDYAINSLKPSCSHNNTFNLQNVRESFNGKANGLMDKATVLMQMFASTHFGAKPPFKKNILKKTSEGNHWGNLRAQLEVDIQEVASLASALSYDHEQLKLAMKSARNSQPQACQKNQLSNIQPFLNGISETTRNSYVLSSDSDDDIYDCYDWNRNMTKARYKGDSVSTISRELTTAVRKNFAMTLQRLIEHGLREDITSVTSSVMTPFLRCLNPYPSLAAEVDRSRMRHLWNSSNFADNDASGASAKTNTYEDHSYSGYMGRKISSFRPMHAWELIVEYYYLKNGDEYNNTPARKLSDSFHLEITDSTSVTAKQNLLTTIGSIIAMHQPYKRSFNAHFKAFVCAGLNSKRLVEWLGLIFNCRSLIELYYTSNSYIMRSGFRDLLSSIDILTKYDFDLPVDFAVRHFKNI